MSDGTVLVYAHLDSFASGIKIGEKVAEGQVVGQAGTSGNAQGINPPEQHLHFAVINPDGSLEDPELWLNDPDADPPAQYDEDTNDASTKRQSK